jgi:hypothetical protein
MEQLQQHRLPQQNQSLQRLLPYKQRLLLHRLLLPVAICMVKLGSVSPETQSMKS